MPLDRSIEPDPAENSSGVEEGVAAVVHSLGESVADGEVDPATNAELLEALERLEAAQGDPNAGWWKAEREKRRPDLPAWPLRQPDSASTKARFHLHPSTEAATTPKPQDEEER